MVLAQELDAQMVPEKPVDPNKRFASREDVSKYLKQKLKRLARDVAFDSQGRVTVPPSTQNAMRRDLERALLVCRCPVCDVPAEPQKQKYVCPQCHQIVETCCG